MQYDVNSGVLQVVIEGEEINAVVGESARIDVGTAIDYIKTGQAEIEEAVQEGISEFNDNATSKTNDFNDNASTKTTDFNTNASNKTSSFNENYTEKLNDFNSNASDKTTDFNSNASDKTSSFNDNYTDKLNDFNSNATDKTNTFNQNATDKTTAFNNNATNKTTDFNDNASAKQALVDAGAQTATDKAAEASSYANTAKQWAIGEPTEPTGNSAKYWAQQAESSLSGLNSRVSDIEDLIPNTASSNNKLTDENFVNSSIATNTANFIGTFANVTALNSYSGTVTNNDYAFVTNSVVTDNGNDWATFNDLNAYDKSLLTDFDYAWIVNGANFDLYRFDIVNQVWELRATAIEKSSVTLNSAFNRYKATVNGSTTWNYEYTLNNSSFTAAQWEAINSSITSEKVALITPFTGADGTNAGTTGLVTPPSATDNTKFLKGDGTWGLPTASTAWGNITGTLSNQTDLQNALNAKQDNLTAGGNIDITSNTVSLKKDGTSITNNSSGQIQAAGVIDSNNTTNAIKTWTGTKAQYDAIVSKDANTLYNITDDTDATATLLATLYPVGSIYITTANTCPLATLISGSTWELVGTDRVLQGSGNYNAGSTVAAGLPNIKGTVAGAGYGTFINAAQSGALTNTSSTYSSTATHNSGTANVYGIRLDASLSNSIYGNSSTVQPPAYVVNIYRRTA